NRTLSGEWRAKARAFAATEVQPRAVAIDRDDRIPPELIRALGAARFTSLSLPSESGGEPADTASVSAVLEELAAASAAVAVTLAVHLSVCAAPIARWGSPEQQHTWLPSLARGERIGAFGLTEPGAGSDTASLRTRYERTSDGFLLSGSKTFISNAATAGLLLIFATKDPCLGSHGISGFLVPGGTDGFTVTQRFDKLGLRGSETTELLLDKVRLPAAALLGPEGAGLKVALSALEGGRVGIASCALGVARAAFEEMRRVVRADDAEWKRTLLARAYVELESARALVEQAARLRDAGAPYALAASTAKLVASRAAVSIASAGLDVAGPDGARSGAEPERLLRDARVFPIVEGTTEIQEMILARTLLEGETPRTA
ncbi:MAG: acyl-CoA dehydrogenase family protein, partial [Thermoplasmata archaeon]|nr:acyl-CoA dehydrogenase family protein [Thermoplasmata archaeon]